MSTITIPESLKSAVCGNDADSICDESGNILGYYMPNASRREATDEDYEWAFKNISQEQIDAAENSGPGRPPQKLFPSLSANTVYEIYGRKCTGG